MDLASGPLSAWLPPGEELLAVLSHIGGELPWQA